MQTTITVKKEERGDGNLSVEFLCSTLDLLWGHPLDYALLFE